MRSLIKLASIKTLPLLTLFLCLSCHADSGDTTPTRHIQSIGNQRISNITLACQDFTLGTDAQLLCQHWQGSGKLTAPINLEHFSQIANVHPLQELSTADYAFYATASVNLGAPYQLHIYPNAWIRLLPAEQAHLSEPQSSSEALDFICQDLRCQHSFLWGFVNERIAGENPAVEAQVREQYHMLLAKLNTAAKTEAQARSTANHPHKTSAVKIYFDTARDNLPPYVIRQVPSATPLKHALTAYLNGVSPKESQQGYRSNTLGMTRVDVAINNRVAQMHFYSDTVQVDSPMQVIDFTYNVSQIAEQFASVDAADICINGISNYQTALFANEAVVACPF